MSIPWQRYVDEHARTADTVTAVVVFAVFVLGSGIRVPSRHRPDAVGPSSPWQHSPARPPFRQRTCPRTVLTVTALGAAGAGTLGRLLAPLLSAPVMVALFRPAATTARGPTRTLYAVRMCGAYPKAVQPRAEYVQRSREKAARIRHPEECIRIAHELNDMLTHHLALTNAQAGTAAHLARTHPEQAQESPHARLAPRPGLGHLGRLMDAFDPAGLTVRMITEGAPRPPAPEVDLTAYRIVQQAPTDIAKHAGPSAVPPGPVTACAAASRSPPPAPVPHRSLTPRNP